MVFSSIDFLYAPKYNRLVVENIGDYDRVIMITKDYKEYKDGVINDQESQIQITPYSYAKRDLNEKESHACSFHYTASKSDFHDYKLHEVRYLFFTKNWSQRRIADHLECSLSTIKKLTKKLKINNFRI
jgi:hypothetical protein